VLTHPDGEELRPFAGEVGLHGRLVATLLALPGSPSLSLERVAGVALGAHVLERHEDAAGARRAKQRATARARATSSP